MYQVLINSVDKTSDIFFKSFKATDYINQQANQCNFECRSFKPELDQEIIVYLDSVKVFGGVIVRIDTQFEGATKTYKISCKDYVQRLNRQLISEQFNNMSINDIMQFIVDEYATDFTVANVDCDTVITQVSFNRIAVSTAIQTLADLVGFYWYVDYDKDIHFFAKQSEPAPFNLSETAGNHIWNSLKLTNDFSQIRNQIYVVGGEYEAEARTEKYVMDGEQRQIPLAYKFKTITSVVVDSVSYDVGIDGFDNEDNFSIFWNYSAKYIRFKDGFTLNDGDLVEVTGTPLFPVIVKVPDTDSISQYGLYEYKIVDENLASRTDAIARGVAELEAYAGSINEGSFTTNTYGLKSGQLININIDGTDEDFVIQSVSMSMVTPFEAQWSVKIATARTLGIIQFLQRFLLKDDDIKEGETLLELQQLSDTNEISDDVTVTTETPPYKYADAVSPADEGRYNFSTWE